MNEVTLDLQKISNISYAVEELKNMLEKSMLGTYLGQLLQGEWSYMGFLSKGSEKYALIPS